MAEGWVFDIQRGALHDGPGIRTAVFLQGCPLRCQWCHNPESWETPGRATRMGATEIMETVERDRRFYERSGGGLTVSGGEPTQQLDFVIALLESARATGISTCLDTSGAFGREALERLVDLVDLWLFDLKASGETHRELTRASQGAIRRNLTDLVNRGARIWLRCPLVPGVNDTDEHLDAIASWSHRVERVDIMPYHDVGAHKYACLGLPNPLDPIPSADEAQCVAWLDALRARGAVRAFLG